MTKPLVGTGLPFDDMISSSIAVFGKARATQRMQKIAEVRGWTIFCDEGPQIGGDDSAPQPLTYFAASIMF